MSHLDLVVPLQLFLSVTPLQVHFNLEIADVGLYLLLPVLHGFLLLLSLPLGLALPALLRLQLLLLPLLSRHLGGQALNDHSLNHWQSEGQFEIRRH